VRSVYDIVNTDCLDGLPQATGVSVFVVVVVVVVGCGRVWCGLMPRG
jgi:hypothetical protein